MALGAGAAGIACLRMLLAMGVRRERITMLDREGVVHAGREGLSPEKREFARETGMRTPLDAMEGADLFLGVSGPRLLTRETVGRMAERPIVFALANPTPEIMPEEARAAAPGALIATGLGLPQPGQRRPVLPLHLPRRARWGRHGDRRGHEGGLRRGHRGAGARAASAELGAAYAGERLLFGPDTLIPKPFDPRLLPTVATAVARAAMESGVATRPLDLDAHREGLRARVHRSALVMRPVFEAARRAERRVALAEGEEPRVLRAAHAMLEEGVARPIVIGRPEVVEARIEREGLTIRRASTSSSCPRATSASARAGRPTTA